ncbi:MAG: hypothetical protein ACR2MS_07680 [Weeksellaceae bacterium]
MAIAYKFLYGGKLILIHKGDLLRLRSFPHFGVMIDHERFVHYKTDADLNLLKQLNFKGFYATEYYS